MLNMREEEEFLFLELTLVKKKLETLQKKGTRENKILVSSLWRESVIVCFLVVVRV